MACGALTRSYLMAVRDSVAYVSSSGLVPHSPSTLHGAFEKHKKVSVTVCASSQGRKHVGSLNTNLDQDTDFLAPTMSQKPQVLLPAAAAQSVCHGSHLPSKSMMLLWPKYEYTRSRPAMFATAK